MAFLTITRGAHTVTLDVSTDGARERERVQIGSSDRAFSGRWRSDVSAEFRQLDFSAPRITDADYTELLAACALDRLCAVSGDAIGGAPINAIVKVTEVPFVDDVTDGGYFTRAVTLSVLEG